MEAVVDQTLGDVVHAHARGLRQRPQVDDALVRDQVARAGVEHRVVRLQALGDVVGTEHRHLGGALEALAAHQAHVRPRDRQDARRTPRSGRDRADARLRARGRLERVVRQVRGQVRPDTDRADARTAAAVRDAEGLVQVQVRDVAAEVTRLGEAHQGVQVGTVDVDLAAGLVHLGADVGDVLLEHTVRRGVRDHQHGELVTVLLDLGAEVGRVHLAVVGGLDDDDLHAGHHGAGGVGAVRGRRDQADGALLVAVRPVVGADGQQAGELTLGAGVRLDGDLVVAGHLAETFLQLVDEREVALGLLHRREGVQLTEFGPGHRLHLGGRVELHGAGAQRDHAAVQRVVLVRELAQVAQHRGLGAVLVEDRVGQVRVRAQQALGQRVGRGRVQRLDVRVDTEGGPDGLDVGAQGGLVAGDGDEVGVHLEQVDPALAGGGGDLGGTARHAGGDRVEVRAVHDLDPAGRQTGGEQGGVAVGTARDRPQAVRAVVDGVHAGHDGEQHLRGTDVAGGLLTADVLLTGLQREAVRLVAVRVHGDADEAAGQGAGVLVLDGHVTGVRSAEAHRDAEALGGADGDVRAERTRGGEQGQREQVRGDGDDGAELVRLVDDRLDVPDGTGGARVLDQDTVDAALGDLGRDAGGQVGDDDLDADRLGAGLDDGDGLRQRVDVHQEDVALGLAHAAGQGHGLGGRSALVEQRGARGRQPGQLGDDRLEVQERFEAALGDLRLVGRVRRVPGRVLHDVAEDHRRREGPVVAETDHRREDLVAVGERAQLGQHLGLGARLGQVERLSGLDHIRDRGSGQFVQGAVAHLGEHLRLRLGIRADVALFEGDASLQLGERNAVGGHVRRPPGHMTCEGHHGAGTRTASPSVICT